MMGFSLAYVIACYFGPRRVFDKQYIINPYDYIDWQLASIATYSLPAVDRFVFVANGDYPKHLMPLDQYLPPRNLAGVPIDVLQRPNHGMSYGAWNHAIETYGDQYDFYFLTEDDYVAVQNPLIPFSTTLKSDVGYVCSLYQWGHAAISNGLVRTKAVFDAGGIPFSLSSDYGKNEQQGQVAMSKVIEEAGWKVVGLDKRYSIPFLEANGGIIEYGNPKGSRVLSPVKLERESIDTSF